MQNENEMVNLRKLNKPSIGQKIRMAGAKMASFFVHQNVTSRDKQGKYATKNGLRDLPKLRWGRIVALVILVAIAGGLYVYKGHAQVYGYDAVAEDQQLYMINVTRRNAGLKTLKKNDCVWLVARKWSRSTLAKNNALSHSNFQSIINNTCHVKILSGGENVGMGYDSLDIFNAFMNSAGHKANILRPQFNQVGVGAWRDSRGKLFITQEFIQL